ncbi:MAG: hypothetical protein U0003_03315 [Vampirovibrionales bacterium]
MPLANGQAGSGQVAQQALASHRLLSARGDDDSFRSADNPTSGKNANTPNNASGPKQANINPLASVQLEAISTDASWVNQHEIDHTQAMVQKAVGLGLEPLLKEGH